LLVEFDDGSLGVRPQWRGRGADGVGRLQGVAPLNTVSALPAPAEVEVELPVNGLARDLDLELLGDVGFVEGATTVGACVGQRGLVDLVNLFGGRRLAVGLDAIVLAWLAARLARRRLGLALGERRGLALAGAEGLVELAAEALVLGLEVVDALLKGLAVGTPDRFHAGIIRVCRPRSCAEGSSGTAQHKQQALIKYEMPLDRKQG
jgi:hypothetical protein